MLKRKKKSVLDRAGETVEGLIPVVEQTFESAMDTAKDALAEGRSAAERATDVASDKATKLATGKKAKAAKAASKKAAKAASGKAAQTVAKVKEEKPAPRKGRKVRRFLLVGALVAVGGFVFKTLRDQGADQSSAPAPASRPTPPAPPAAPATPSADVPTAAPAEPVAASPGESLADAAATPVADTTPDNPAEVVDLDAPEESDRP